MKANYKYDSYVVLNRKDEAYIAMDALGDRGYWIDINGQTCSIANLLRYNTVLDNYLMNKENYPYGLFINDSKKEIVLMSKVNTLKNLDITKITLDELLIHPLEKDDFFIANLKSANLYTDSDIEDFINARILENKALKDDISFDAVLKLYHKYKHGEDTYKRVGSISEAINILNNFQYNPSNKPEEKEMFSAIQVLLEDYEKQKETATTLKNAISEVLEQTEEIEGDMDL